MAVHDALLTDTQDRLLKHTYLFSRAQRNAFGS